MITTETAKEIAVKNNRLAEAEYCLKNIGKCIGELTITATDETPYPITFIFEEIQGHDFKCLIEAVIDNLKSRLDELNILAIQEAQE